MCQEFKICLVGSKNFNDFNRLKSEVVKALDDRKYLIEGKSIIMLCGLERGIGEMSLRFAREKKFNIEEYPIMWNNIKDIPCKIKLNAYGRRYNSLAAFNRDNNMILKADLVLFMNCLNNPISSNGLNLCENLGKDYLLINC